MVNINIELFKKYKPENKLLMINKLTREELLNIKSETISRIIKEVGEGSSYSKRCHNKELRLKTKVSNDWNCTVDEVHIYKKVPYIGFTVLLDDTDPYDSDTVSNFLGYGTYRGSYTYEDRYDKPQTSYYSYNENKKAEVIKTILLTYIEAKYNCHE